MGVIGKGLKALFRSTTKTDKAVLAGAAGAWAGAAHYGLLRKPKKKPSKPASPIATRPVNKGVPGKTARTPQTSPWDSLVEYKAAERKRIGMPSYSDKLNKAAFEDAFDINVTKGRVDETHNGRRIHGPHGFNKKELGELRKIILSIPKHEGVGSKRPSEVGGPKSKFSNIKEAYENPYAALWATLDFSGPRVAFDMGDYVSSAGDTAIRGGPTPTAVARAPKFRRAAGMATATVAKNYRRYIEKAGKYKGSTGKRGDMEQFIKELGPIYAPPGAREDTLDVNKSWAAGVTKFYKKLKKK